MFVLAAVTSQLLHRNLVIQAVMVVRKETSQVGQIQDRTVVVITKEKSGVQTEKEVQNHHP